MLKPRCSAAVLAAAVMPMLLPVPPAFAADAPNPLAACHARARQLGAETEKFIDYSKHNQLIAKNEESMVRELQLRQAGANMKASVQINAAGCETIKAAMETDHKRMNAIADRYVPEFNKCSKAAKDAYTAVGNMLNADAKRQRGGTPETMKVRSKFSGYITAMQSGKLGDTLPACRGARDELLGMKVELTKIEAGRK